MKLIKTITCALFALTATACSIDIDADGHYSSGQDHISVELKNGERAALSCPRGTSSYVKRDADGKLIEYGCKAD